MKNWIIDQNEQGKSTVTHGGPPRFTALWTTGGDPDELAAIDGPCWTDEGSGGEDAIHLYGFKWTGTAPDQDEFNALMKQTIRAIDDWIARHM
jgi:hypothetical protein